MNIADSLRGIPAPLESLSVINLSRVVFVQPLLKVTIGFFPQLYPSRVIRYAQIPALNVIRAERDRLLRTGSPNNPRV